ncbi:MAG TPA: hypothetical protein VHD63_15910 [Ktedonobacteraceae bacterium]|nr:hypothetical protein [Ktedonobacteraceae bacterium]
MMEFRSYKSGAAFAPPHPTAFRLLGSSRPLAGPHDTYWIARAIWMDDQSGDEGFLIYADHLHYLFLDDVEARTASLLISSQQPQVRRSRARGTQAYVALSRYLRRLRARTFVQTRTLRYFASVPLLLLILPALARLALVLLTFFLCLGLSTLLSPHLPLGAVLVLPVALASWCFGWRGCLWTAGSVMLASAAGTWLQPGHSVESFPWLASFILGSLSSLLIGLFIAALRQITDRLLAQCVHLEQEQLTDRMQPPFRRTFQPLLALKPGESQYRLEELENSGEGVWLERRYGKGDGRRSATGAVFTDRLTCLPACEDEGPEHMEALASD